MHSCFHDCHICITCTISQKRACLYMFDTIINSMVVQRYYRQNNRHIMEQPLFTVTQNGFLLFADQTQYILEWVGKMLKVTGPDTCYYLLETLRGLEQANCTLTTFTVLIGNN